MNFGTDAVESEQKQAAKVLEVEFRFTEVGWASWHKRLRDTAITSRSF